MQFDQCIVVRNPVSTNARYADERVADLRRAYPKATFTIVMTTVAGRAANKQLLRKHADKLGRRTLLCIAAGDGTVNMVVEALVADPYFSDEARRTPVLPLWCGNANDLAYMLNGAPSATAIERVVQKGHAVSVRPLVCTLTSASMHVTPETRLAVCYASFGATAFAARALEASMRKDTRTYPLPGFRFVRELAVAAIALYRAPRFDVEEAGQKYRIFERIFLNGSRFAKVAAVPLDLTDEYLHSTTVTTKRFSSVFFHIAKLTKRTHTDDVTVTHAAFTLDDDVWAQFDGETMRIPRGTKVDITLSPRPFFAPSILLTNK